MMRTALVYNFLIEANIMASIAIVLLMLIRRFLRKPLGNRMLCFGWLLVAVRLLLPVSLPNPWIWTIHTPMQPDAAIRPIAGQVQIRFRDLVSDLYWQSYSRLGEDGITRQLRVLDNTTDNGILSRQLMMIYILGVAVVLIWFAVSNLLFRRRLKADRIEPVSGELLTQYEEICSRYRVKPVPVYFTDPLPAACLVGMFRPYIALPLTAKPGEAVQVLTHEVCHLRGRDHVWAVVRLACLAVNWFNPLVWIAAKMSRTDLELACDDRVTRQMDLEDRKAYAGVLVLAASRRTSPGLLTLATGMTMTGRTLRTRIASVLSEKKTVRVLAIAFAVLTSVCLIGAFMTRDMYDRRLPSVFNPSKTDYIPDSVQSADFSLDAEYLKHLTEDEDDRNTTLSGMWDSAYIGESSIRSPFTAVSDSGTVVFSDSQGEPVLQYDEQGRLLYLNNPASRWDAHSYIFSDYAIWDDSEEAELRVYLQGFLNSFAPQVGTVSEFFNMGERQTDLNRFVDFAFKYLREDPKAKDGLEERVGILTLQVVPETRIVHFEDQPLTQAMRDEIGNG